MKRKTYSRINSNKRSRLSNLDKRSSNEFRSSSPSNISSSNLFEEQLHTKGYQIYKNTLVYSEEFLDEIKKQSDGCKAIFNYNSDNNEDHKRKMRNLCKSKKCVSLFVCQMTDKLKSIAPMLEPDEWVILKSSPGCQAQAAHTDYIPDDQFRSVTDETMPLLAIISLMDGTKIDVWPNSIRLITQAPLLEGFHYKKPNTPHQLINGYGLSKKVEYLNKGDMLIFRGDLIHAGSAYDEENIRIHVYLDSPTIKHMHNRVNFVTFSND